MIIRVLPFPPLHPQGEGAKGKRVRSYYFS